MANSIQPVIVRIKGANSEGKDWMIPSEVSFRMVLVSMKFLCCCLLDHAMMQQWLVVELAPASLSISGLLIKRSHNQIMCTVNMHMCF